MQEKIKSGTLPPPNLKQLHGVKFSIVQLIYQNMVDHALCNSTLTEKRDSISYNEYYIDLDACIAKKVDYYTDMLGFIAQYGTLDDKAKTITVCRAKTEMLEAEQKCPPYEWMLQIAGNKNLGAYDAQAFLVRMR